MCLTVKKTNRMVAEEDIIVYKRLKLDFREEESFNSFEKYNGKPFKAIVKNMELTGTLSFDGKELFLCSDHCRFNGMDTCQRYGHNYSWALDSNVKSIIVDGEEILKFDILTPYQHCKISIGETYTSELILDVYTSEVNVGIHSFETLEDALEYEDSRNIFVRCIIPAGSEYYKGFFGEYNSYASNKLTYLEIIERCVK